MPVTGGGVRRGEQRGGGGRGGGLEGDTFQGGRRSRFGSVLIKIRNETNTKKAEERDGALAPIR